MVFSSLIFLYVFLPAVLVLCYVLPASLRHGLLLLVSLLFYAWGEPVYVLLMLGSILVNYALGLGIDRAREKLGKPLLALACVLNLGVLAFFKYTDFAVSNLNALLGTSMGTLQLALPIGISFYTFQTLSYVIDVYRGTVPVQKNIIRFGMYVTMFPQLIAGPIVRYSDIMEQLEPGRETREKFASGILRFCIGLGKKVLLANRIGALWNEIAAYAPENLTAGMAWLGALAFMFQIYFDFSGYSDMAIGLGRMLGFDFPENFRHPYECTSITDFWRRWHITLGTWFREYLYIPLGGNRCKPARQACNMLIVWALTGLWHGAGWNFLLWGLYFFLILLLEKRGLLRKMERWPEFFRHLYALLLILLGWVLFAVDSPGALPGYFAAMLGFGAKSGTGLYDFLQYLPLLVLCAMGSTAYPAKLAGKLTEKLGSRGKSALEAGFCAVILFAATAVLVSSGYNPFLYFRF